MHEANVKYDVGSFGDFDAVNGVVLQSFSHGEIDHRVEPQTLVDEDLEHFQTLIIHVFCSIFTLK